MIQWRRLLKSSEGNWIRLVQDERARFLGFLPRHNCDEFGALAVVGNHPACLGGNAVETSVQCLEKLTRFVWAMTFEARIWSVVVRGCMTVFALLNMLWFYSFSNELGYTISFIAFSSSLLLILMIDKILSMERLKNFRWGCTHMYFRFSHW